MKKDFKRTTSLMMASMMITMSVFSDVSVSAQDIPELDVMSEVLSSGSALEPGGSSGDAGNDEITEETTETTTEVTEEESEATAEDKTNNGLLEDKEIIDENEGEIEVSVDKTVVAYHGLAEGTVATPTHDGVEITVPADIITALKADYDAANDKVYWTSSVPGVVATETATADGVVLNNIVNPKPITVAGVGETILTMNIADTNNVDLKTGIYKVRVKCVQSPINDTTNDPNNVKDVLFNSNMIYVDVAGGAKPISIELDQDAGDVTWNVYEPGKLTPGTGAIAIGTVDATFLQVDDSANGSSTAGTIDTKMSSDVESEGKYKTTVFLKPQKVGVVYLEATVKSNITGTPKNIIVYRRKVNIGLTDKAVVQEKLDAYINGLVDVSFKLPTSVVTTGSNATWSISSTTNFVPSTTSLAFVGADAASVAATAEKGTTGTSAGTTSVTHDVANAAANEHQFGATAASSGNDSEYTVGIALPKLDSAGTATGIVAEPITLTARIDGAIVYEALLNVHAKPAINENLDDVSEDPTKHEASYQNATNIKISDTDATKIEIPELLDKKYIGNITWEIFNDIAYDKEETITTGNPNPVIGSESSKGTGTATPVQVCDTAAGTFAATASTTDPFVYVKPNTGTNAKAGAMYIQARLNADPATAGSGTVVYVGKVYVNPETVTEERVSFFAETTDKVFSFSGLKHGTNNDLFDVDTNANRSLEWKLKYYEVSSTTGALTDVTDYTGSSNANSPLKYVQFTDTTTPASDMAISMPVDVAGGGKVRVQATTDAIPADHVVMLVASIKGAEVYKYRITTSTVPNVTQGTKRITNETVNTEIALETPNLGSLNYGDVQWQVYTDSAYTHLASDANSILKLNPAAGTGSTTTNDKVSVTKPVAEVQENVYKSVIAAKAQGKVGTAYVQAKVDGRIVSKTIVHIGKQQDDGKVVMYNEDKMDLEYTDAKIAGKNVLWQQFDAASPNTSASDFALNGTAASTVNTIAAATTGKINLTITAPNSVTAERLITATVDGVEVYRTIVSSIAQPTTIVSNIDTDATPNTTNDVLTLSKSDTTAHLVNLSGLGAVTHSNVKWTAYSQKSDGTGFGDVVNTDTIQFVNAAGSALTDSKIIDGIADVYIKNATTPKLGIVEVRGKVNDIDVYKFRVNVIPDAAAISKENKSIFSHEASGTTAVHTLNGTIDNSDIIGKNITWAIDNTNGTIDTEQSTKVVPAAGATGSAVQVVFNVNANVTTPFYITGYLGNASDGIKVHEFLVTPVAPPSTAEIKDKDRVIAYNATKGIKLETIDLKGANFNQVEWTVYTDSGYSNAATAANALITLSESDTGGTVGLSKKTNISQTDNKTNVYAQVTLIKDIGTNYVQATVDGVAVYQAKIDVTKDNISESDKTIYVNNTHTLKVTLPANVANNTKVVWTQTKNGVAATSFDMNNQSGSTVDTYVKNDGTNQVATLDIKAAAVAPSTKFTATIDGIVVYETNVSAIERPNITSSIDTNADTTDDTISYVISATPADVTEVTLSGFGNVSNADIEWKIFDLDTDQVNFKNVATGNHASNNAIALTTDDAGATLITNDKTGLANGSTTVYVKNTGTALTATKVVAYIDGAEIYSFIVGSNPDTGLINTENAAVYSSQKDFEIEGTLHADLVKAAAADKLLNKDDKITWVTDDNGLIMNTDTRTNTLSEATVGVANSIGTGKIKLAIKDLSAVKKDVVTVTAYYGDAKFGIKLLEYKIAVNKEANKDDVANQVDFTILKSEIDDATSYNGVIDLAIDDLAPGLSGNVQWNLYDNYVKAGDAANTIIKDISGKQLLLESGTDLVASTSTSITTGAAPAASTASAKLKVNGYGRVYAVATYNGAVVYRAKINIIDATKKETLTMYVNNSTTLKVDAFANKEILVNATDIVWTCGNGTEESADIVSLNSQSPTLTANKESQVTVNAKAKGTAIVRATDADGQVVYENTITVVEQPIVNTIDIKTSVGNDITKTITGLTGFTSGVEWKAYTGTTTTATTNKEIIFNDDDTKDTATTAIDAKGSTSIKFKAGPASVQNAESVYTVVGTVDGIVVAKYEVTVSIDTIVEVNKKFADKVEHKISLGDEYKGKTVYWSTGTIEKDKEVQATSDNTNASNDIGLFTSSGSATDIFSTMPATTQMTEGNIYLKSGVAAVDSTTYYIKGICDGVEICKIYFKVTEDETGLTPVTIAKSYKDAVETFTPATPANGDKWIIGTMSDVVVDSNGNVESYTENDPSNSTLQFTAAINKSEYLTTTTNPVTIKTVGTGWSYVKVIKSGKVTDKWYVNVVESPITDVKFTKGIKTAKVNGLDEVTAQAGNDLEYDLTLYVDNGEIKDNYLVSNNLSKLLLQPTITGTGTATEKELRYTFTAGTDNLTGTSFKLAKNEKGVYYVEPTTKTATTTPESFYIETLLNKGVQVSNADVPLRRIKVNLTLKDVSDASEVNAAAPQGTITVNTDDYTPYELAAAKRTTGTKLINAGGKLRFRIINDGTKDYVSVVEVEKNTTSGAYAPITADTLLEIPDGTMTNANSTVPEGKWIICANGFDNDNGANKKASVNNAKTSSAAKFSKNGGTSGLVTTINDEGEIYLVNTKSKGTTSNQIWVRYVNKYDTNIVYAQVPVTIAPAKADGMTLKATGMGTMKAGDGATEVYSLNATVGSKVSIKPTLTNTSNKGVTYEVVTTANATMDPNTADYTVTTKPNDYIQISSSGIITPIKATAVAAGATKTEYVKVKVTSDDNPTLEKYIYITVANPKVNAMILSSGSISLATGNYQVVTLRLNPSYNYADNNIVVNYPADAPYKVYNDAGCTSNDEVAIGSKLNITNGMIDLYVKMENDAEIKGKEAITFSYDETGTKVKDVKLTVKRIASQSNITSVVQKNTKEFAAPVGIPYDLKTTVNPATAMNDINWTVKVKNSTTGALEAPTAGDHAITNGWFIPLAAKVFSLEGETEGKNSANQVVKTTYNYEVTGYIPATNVGITATSPGSGSTPIDYGLYAGYLKEDAATNTTSTTTIPGGRTLTVTASGVGAANGEGITWTSSSPSGLPLVQAAAAGTSFTLNTNAKGTYTVTGITEYSKQKYSFKVVVGSNIDISGGNENINDNLDDIDGTATLAFGLKDGDTVTPITNLDAYAHTENTLTNGKAQQLIVTAEDVAFDSISFASSNTKLLTVSATGMLSPKAETGADEYVTVTVTMTGKAKNADGKTVTVKVTRDIDFSIGHADVSVTNLGSYIAKDTYAVRNKAYTFTAKVKGTSASKVNTAWQVFQGSSFNIADAANTNSFDDLDSKDYFTSGKNNTAKVTFDEYATAGDYYIYPTITALDSNTVYYDPTDENNNGDDPTIPAGATSGQFNFTGLIQKFTLLNNVISTVTTSQKTIDTVKGATANDVKTFTVYVKGFAVDGEPVDATNVIWTSSNNSIAEIGNIAKGTAGTVEEKFYNSVEIKTKNVSGTATVTGLLKNSGKKVSIKVNVKDTANADRTPTVIKINNNRDLTLKLDKNGNSIKQIDTTFFADTAATKANGVITEEVWTISELKSGGDKTVSTDFENETEFKKVTDASGNITFTDAATGTGSKISGVSVDASGNIITTKECVLKVTKTVKIDGGTAITMGTDAEGKANNIIITVR